MQGRGAARGLDADRRGRGRSKIGVFNCGGELLAIEDRCSHDDGPLAEGEFDAATCTVECPRHGSLFDLRSGTPEDASRLRSRSRPSRSGSRTAKSSWRLTEHEPTRDRNTRARSQGRRARGDQGHQPGLQGEVRVQRPRDRLRLQGAQGPQPRSSSRTSPSTRTSRSGCATSGSRRCDHFLARPVPQWGADLEPDRLRQHPLLRARLRALRERAGTTSPTTSRTRSTSSGSPRPSASSSPASAPSTSPRSSTTRSTRSSRPRASISLDMDTALKRARGPDPRALRDGDPANDNMLAALNSAVWSGGSFVYVPKGVKVEMPLQAYFRINTENMGQFERTLIIADEGSDVHYIEGCTAPVYSTDSLHSAVVELIARPGAQDPLHDRPELVAERLQPRHQAGDGRRGRRDHRVGRLQPRLEGDDEVPVDLPDGRARPRRDPLDRLRRQRPAPGRGRQDHPRGPEDDQRRSSPSRSPRTAAARPTAACSRSPRAPARSARRSSATRCCSTPSRARTPTRRSGSTRTTPTSATRPRSRRSARSSSSTCSRTGSTRRRPRR